MGGGRVPATDSDLARDGRRWCNKGVDASSGASATAVPCKSPLWSKVDGGVTRETTRRAARRLPRYHARALSGLRSPTTSGTHSSRQQAKVEGGQTDQDRGDAGKRLSVQEQTCERKNLVPRMTHTFVSERQRASHAPGQNPYAEVVEVEVEAPHGRPRANITPLLWAPPPLHATSP
jgi:hypothetical protein